MFPDAPVIFSANAAPDARLHGAGAGLTGIVSQRASIAETMELALTLHPSTERVLVVAQAPARGFVEEVQAALDPFTTRVALTMVSERTSAGLIAAVKAARPGSLILFVRHSQEDPGNVVFPNEAARLVAEASRVPVYGISEGHVGTGVVGGMMRPWWAHGARIGEMTRQILDGARAADIPIEDVPTIPVFDWRQVQRWGIDPSRLPAGADIRFRVSTPWELYGWYIAGAVRVDCDPRGDDCLPDRSALAPS